jgi:glyoxylase-like metal-dependent hydrolase (beta-lactamase superfamily II)
MPSKITLQLPGLLALACLTCSNALAQNSQPVLGGDAVKISDHVWAIMGFPNVAIVIGDRATLVVDTGLGPRNGATVAAAAAKLSSNNPSANQKLFLTTTHFHPEHAAGEAGFPANTILIRDAVQQREMEQHGAEMVETFSGRSPLNKELLAGVKLRSPDVVFDTEAKVDLGGVNVRLLWFGGAHTKGDELIFVEPDGTLVSGDVVQNRVVPNIYGDGGTPSSWIAVLDKISALPVRHVLPDHSAPADGSLVLKERAFIDDLRTRALALKRQGVSADEAGTRLSAEFKTKYSDWPNMNVGNFVRSIYGE